jgi:hypothetical protein
MVIEPGAVRALDGASTRPSSMVFEPGPVRPLDGASTRASSMVFEPSRAGTLHAAPPSSASTERLHAGPPGSLSYPDRRFRSTGYGGSAMNKNSHAPMIACLRLAAAATALCGVAAAAEPPRAGPPPFPELQAFFDATGVTATLDVNGPQPQGAFFQSLGTNGRSCATCHGASQAMGLSAQAALTSPSSVPSCSTGVRPRRRSPPSRPSWRT